MKTSLSKNIRALTLIELMVVLAVIMLLAALVLPRLFLEKRKALRIHCFNNLKQTGLAFRIWTASGNNYTMGISTNYGGTMEFITGLNAYRHFQVMSNELSTPKVLFCPAETDRNRFVGTNFNINNSNISYFVGVDANETNVQMLLSGDHNVTNGTPVKNGLLELTTNTPSGWTAEMHKGVGNVALADGSVQQLSITGLRSAVTNTGCATNRLQMP